MNEVYLGGPITGHTYRTAQSWRRDPSFRRELALAGWVALSPLDQHDPPSDWDIPLDAFFEEQIGESVASVVSGDLRMIRQSQAVMFNFLGYDRASIGSAAELGYAKALDKPIVSVVRPDDIHYHPFVTELSDFVVSESADVPLILAGIAQARRSVPYA